MFKWLCLLVAVVFLAALTWMVNDVRVAVLNTAATVQTTSKTINEKLPALVDRSEQALATVNGKLPEIVENVHLASEAVADLAGDLGQLREFAGSGAGRDKDLLAYADSMLSTVEKSGGTIGVKKPLGGPELTRTKPANEWVANAHREAGLLSILTHSKKEMAHRLLKTPLGSPWYIQVGEKDAVQLLDWVKANHPESMGLW